MPRFALNGDTVEKSTSESHQSEPHQHSAGTSFSHIRVKCCECVAAAIAGFTATWCSQPLDVIKTRIQTSSTTTAQSPTPSELVHSAHSHTSASLPVHPSSPSAPRPSTVAVELPRAPATGGVAPPLPTSTTPAPRAFPIHAHAPFLGPPSNHLLPTPQSCAHSPQQSPPQPWLQVQRLPTPPIWKYVKRILWRRPHSSMGVTCHAKAIYKADGVRGFFRGIWPRLSTNVPSAVCMLVVYEYAMQWSQ